MAKQNNTKVVTGLVRLSYANVWEPKSINGGDPKFSCSIIIPKTDVETVNAINAAIDCAIKDGIGKFGGKIPPKGALKLPLRDGDTARWYLREDDYGSITISVNASVSVIGSYRTTQSGEAEIAVSFDSITVNAGAVYLDILSFEAVPGKSSVSVAKGASLSVSRSEFVGSGTEHMAVAIRAGTGYAGELSVTDTYVKGYANALYMETGSANVSDSVFEYNNIAVNVLTGTVTLNGNTFRGMTEKAVYIGLSDAVNPVIADNEFLANVIAVESFVPLRNDIDAQNKFSQNASDIVSHVSV